MRILHIGKAGNMQRFSAPDSALYRTDTEIIDMPMGLNTAEYIEKAPETEHIIADAIGEVSAELINGLPKLRSVHSEGVAFNRIDTAAARSRGVYVCHSAGMNASAVAEQTLLLMVGLLRGVISGDAAVRAGRQIEVKEGYMKRGDLKELADCRVGLVGCGDIGKAVAHLLRAYGVNEILYCKRSPLSPDAEAELGVKYAPLDRLLETSDIVSLHLPVTPATRGMVNGDFFGKMKPGALLINTARGELVDDAALIDALECGRLAGAGLDTLDNEPVKADHPLLNAAAVADRLLFSPHIGGITASSFRRSYQMIWEDIETVRSGRVPARAVN